MPGLDLGIGAGANLVGGTVQAVAASLAAQAMQREFEREMLRQQRYRNEAFGGLQPYLPTLGVETARQQIAQGAQNRMNLFGQVGQAPLALGAQPNQVEQARYGLLGQARANLGGYSDWQLNQMINAIRAQDELNRISSFSRGTAQVFPYRMYDAQHSQDQLAFFGNLISSLGGSAGNWASLFGTGPQQGTLPSDQTLFNYYPTGQV